MYKEIIRLLDDNRLKEALARISAYAASVSSWELKEETEYLQTSYGLMLEYALRGLKDPGRGEQFRRMKRTAYELADRVHALAGSTALHAVRDGLAAGPQHSIDFLRRELERLTAELEVARLLYSDREERLRQTEETRRKRVALTDELFNKAWTSTHWNEAEAAEADAMLAADGVTPNDVAVLTSGVTLSLLAVFDVRKFLFLADAFGHAADIVNRRAVTGIALAAYYHAARLRLYPEAEARLTLLNDDETYAEALCRVQTELLQSARETQKVDRRMREIIPQIIKGARMKKPWETDLEKREDEDGNPEWEAWIDRSGIGERLHELGELQTNGADIYMSTFAQLKIFPFFRQAAHWFYPFDPEHPDLAATDTGDEKSPTLLGALMASDLFCNTDKYSFSLAISRMDAQQRSFLARQFGQQQELSEETKAEMLAGLRRRAEKNLVIRQYVQDLYRFFKLWAHRSEMHDIFADRLDLWKSAPLSPALRQKEHIRKLADYLFSHGYLDEAGELYEEIISLHARTDAQLWQKTGYAAQKAGDYEKAIRCYLQADLFAPDNVWNNRRLAQCYRKSGRHEQALEYYRKVEQAEPERLDATLLAGQCLVELGRYDEALTCFFKVEYLDKSPQDARRAIAWCYLMTGCYDKAVKYYDLLLGEPQPTRDDWMNAGHVCHLRGQTERAVECYRKSQELCGGHDEFIRLFRRDADDLMRLGLDEADLSVLLDELA